MAIRICLVMLVIFCPLAIDLYLPAFPTIITELHTNDNALQLSIGLFMLSVGLGQLVFGPLSDTFGRKKIALIGIAIYGIAAMFCALASNIEMLLAGRLMQGLGAAATFVSTFSIVRDQYDANKSAQVLSYLNGFVCFIPALAPVIGAWLTLRFSWQANFSFLVLISILGFILIATALKSDTPVTRPNLSISFNRFSPMLKSAQFMFNALLCLLAMAAILAYVSKAPIYMMEKLALNEKTFTMWFSSNAVISITTCFLAPQIIKFSSRLALTIGLLLLIISGVWLLLLPDNHSVIEFMLPIFISSAGFALTLGSAAGGALAPFKNEAGAASALVGLMQMSGAGLLVSIGQFLNLTAPVAIGVHLLLVLPFLILLLSKSKYLLHPVTSHV